MDERPPSRQRPSTPRSIPYWGACIKNGACGAAARISLLLPGGVTGCIRRRRSQERRPTTNGPAHPPEYGNSIPIPSSVEETTGVRFERSFGGTYRIVRLVPVSCAKSLNCERGVVVVPPEVCRFLPIARNETNERWIHRRSIIY